MYSCVLPVFSGYRIGWAAKLRGTENPIGIREVVQKAKVLEAAISGVKAIPLRLFDAYAKITLRIGSPTR